MNDDQMKELLLNLGERRVAQKQGTLERHAQTGLTSLVVVLLSAFGAGLWAMNQTQHELVSGQKIFAIQMGNLADKIELQNTAYVSKLEYELHRQDVESRLISLEAEPSNIPNRRKQ